MSKKPEILGYGEDALTLWALKNYLPKILERLHDNTPQAKCLVFYRPSFGRAGGEGSAEFGEFDAIIATRSSVYLVESKWDSLGKSRIERIELEEAQKSRHDVFSWYVARWNSKYSNHWESFRSECEDDLWKKHKKKIPKEDSTLARNLKYVLDTLHGKLKPSNTYIVKNVLLFFSLRKQDGPMTERDFHLVNIVYGESLKHQFVAMG
jgi:hypothetical protein